MDLKAQGSRPSHEMNLEALELLAPKPHLRNSCPMVDGLVLKKFSCQKFQISRTKLRTTTRSTGNVTPCLHCWKGAMIDLLHSLNSCVTLQRDAFDVRCLPID